MCVLCLRQAAWCHSWRAQPPETSYTPARRVAHTGLQTYEMIGCFWSADDLAVFKACSNTDSNVSTNHVNRRFVCLQILCLLFNKEAMSTETGVTFICICLVSPFIPICVHFPLHAPPSIQSLCICSSVSFLCPRQVVRSRFLPSQLFD